MKFLKKAISAFLASIMCIPAGIVNIANNEPKVEEKEENKYLCCDKTELSLNLPLPFFF